MRNKGTVEHLESVLEQINELGKTYDHVMLNTVRTIVEREIQNAK